MPTTRDLLQCVVVCALHLYPANPGWGSWCVCVGLIFGFHPANPCQGGGECVFLCALRLYPASRGRGVRWVCVLWFGFWLRPAFPGLGVGVCVFVCGFCLYCANPGWGSWCVYVGSGFGLHPASPGWGVGMCVFECVLRMYPAIPGWGVRCGCVCLGSRVGCTPQILAGLLGCVCLCGRPACTPPFLAGVCGVWAACCLAPVPVPWLVACFAGRPGLRHLVAVVAWHLSVCLGCGRRRALWPRVVRCPSSGPFVLGAPVGFANVVGPFPSPGAFRPRLYRAAARGMWRPAENRALGACRWPLLRQGL